MTGDRYSSVGAAFQPRFCNFSEFSNFLILELTNSLIPKFLNSLIPLIPQSQIYNLLSGTFVA